MIKHLVSIFLLVPSFLIGQSVNKDEVKWITQFDEAIDLSTDSGKNILMVFSGSDWCKPCIQLRQKIWESEVFKKFAKDHLVLLELDFPASKKNRLPEEQRLHNEALAEKYNPQGAFPSVVLVDQHGKEITSFDYKKSWTPDDYINFIQTHF